jgi:hypothetical protein
MIGDRGKEGRKEGRQKGMIDKRARIGGRK